MSWQEDYKRIMAERETEQEQIKAEISLMKAQIARQKALAGAIYGIGSAAFGRAA